MNRIKDLENPPRIWLLIQLMNYCCPTAAYLSKKENNNFAADFEAAMKSYFNDGGVNKSVKEFKYDYMDTIKGNLKKILPYGEMLKNKVATNITLDAAYQCLI